MNAETKEVFLSYYDPKKNKREEEVAEQAAFGWELTDQTARHGRTNYSIFIRDRDIPHYYEVVELEKRYFEIKTKKKYYKPIVEDFTDVLLLFLLLILFVLPLVLYVAFKSARKKSIQNYNDSIQKEMDELKNKAQTLMHSK